MNVIGARALVTRLDQPACASKLIEVVQFERPPSQFCFVVAVGNGRRLDDGTRRPLDFAPGDVVITKPFSGAPVQFKLPNGDDQDGYMVMEEDVLAIVEKI